MFSLILDRQFLDLRAARGNQYCARHCAVLLSRLLVNLGRRSPTDLGVLPRIVITWRKEGGCGVSRKAEWLHRHGEARKFDCVHWPCCGPI